LKTPVARLPCSVDAGRTAGTRPVRCRGVAPGMCKAEAPAKGLSTLNSTAFGLAVYASPPGLPHSTQDSLPAAGQALLGGLSTRRAPTEGFRVLLTSHPPSPSFAWRKHIDRGIERPGGIAWRGAGRGGMFCPQHPAEGYSRPGVGAFRKVACCRPGERRSSRSPVTKSYLLAARPVSNRVVMAVNAPRTRAWPSPIPTPCCNTSAT